MSRVAFNIVGGEPSVDFEGCVVRKIEYEHTATTKRVIIEMDTRELPEGPDVILPEATWTVVDTTGTTEQEGVDEVVASFGSKAEAEAAIVGLEHVDPMGVRTGLYTIESPAE